MDMQKEKMSTKILSQANLTSIVAKHCIASISIGPDDCKALDAAPRKREADRGTIVMTP